MTLRCAKCGKAIHNCTYLLDGEDVCRDCFTKEYLVAIYDSEEPKLDRLICPKCKGTREERYTDAAGSRDYRVCTKCDGKGFVIV